MAFVNLSDFLSAMRGYHNYRGGRFYTILTSTNYCISSLVQGRFDIPGCVEVHVPATVKNKEPMKIYETCVDALLPARGDPNCQVLY